MVGFFLSALHFCTVFSLYISYFTEISRNVTKSKMNSMKNINAPGGEFTIVATDDNSVRVSLILCYFSNSNADTLVYTL